MSVSENPLLICKTASAREWHVEGAPLGPVPFIVGTGRCGTTLLRLMLDAHPDLAIPPETHFIPEVSRRCKSATDQYECFIETLSSFRTWPDFHLNVNTLRQRIISVVPFNIGDALRAFYKLYAEMLGKPRWGDKTPIYFASMSLIQQLLPEARFVHLIRDGRDVALSIKDLWFGPNSIREAASWWVSRIQEARRQVDDLHYYLEVRYEDLVCNPEVTLKRICTFIDLDWTPAILDYHKKANERLAELDDTVSPDGKRIVSADERQSVHSLTRKPPAADRVSRWKKEMSHSEQKEFEGVAGEMLRELGYGVGCSSL